MGIASNRYKLNGNDLFDVYGFAVATGSNDLFRFGKRKQSLEFNWEEYDGSQYDLSNPKFDDRELKLSGHLIAHSEADLWSKYNSLWNALKTPGTLQLEVVEMAMSFNVFYEDCPKAERFTRIKNTTKVIVLFELDFKCTGVAAGTAISLPGVNTVNINNQNGVKIDEVQAPGTYQVLQFSGIKDDGSGIYDVSIIDI